MQGGPTLRDPPIMLTSFTKWARVLRYVCLVGRPAQHSTDSHCCLVCFGFFGSLKSGVGSQLWLIGRSQPYPGLEAQVIIIIIRRVQLGSGLS